MRIVSSILLMMALLWLTISLPFVYAMQQTERDINKSVSMQLPADTGDEDLPDPFANTSEEQASNNINSMSEEYLHDTHLYEDHFAVPSLYNKCENVKTYIAFHGELLSPPPEA